MALWCDCALASFFVTSARRSFSFRALCLVMETLRDSDRKVHGPTVGDFTYQAANGRYFLPCKQAAGEKTIKVTVTRPAAMTEFGGEWIQAFPKDSWANVTNEYEPYTFNDLGSKIPLQEFRPTTIDAFNRTIVLDAEDKVTMNVFMEMSVNGDYEMRYGNPQLVTTNDKWIAIEFKKSQLRVGSPWSDCTAAGDDVTAPSCGTVGAIVPAYLGNPSLDNHKFIKLADNLAQTPVPTKVILSIHTTGSDAWTHSGQAGAAY